MVTVNIGNNPGGGSTGGGGGSTGGGSTGGGGIIIVPGGGGSRYDNCTHGKNCPIWPFTDVTSDAWYHDGVHYCLDNGLMNGKSATIFDPNGTTTRGQIVAMLWRLEGQLKASGNSYKDVATGMYFSEAVAWAAANGIVTGYNDGTFKPNTPITREQMATILWRYAKYKALSVDAATDLNGFNDQGQIASYAKEALAWANAEGLVNGKSASVLDPRGSATRAQVATILMRFCGEKKRATYQSMKNLRKAYERKW